MDAKLINTLELNGDVSIPEKYIGPRGYSAYELAVKEGFEGTIDKWLESLHGDVSFSDLTDMQKESLRGPAGKDGRDGEDAIAAINPRGNWDENETYNKNDYVTYLENGNSYTCTADGTTGISPLDATIWQVIALKGAPGEPGKDGLPGLPGNTPTIGLEADTDEMYVLKIENIGQPTIVSPNLKGPRGLSAYEIAKKYGFEGTEEEWLEFLLTPEDELITIEDTTINNMSYLEDIELPCCLHLINSWLGGTFNDDIVYVRTAGDMMMRVYTVDNVMYELDIDSEGDLRVRKTVNLNDEINQIKAQIANITVDDELITIKDTEITNISQLPTNSCCIHAINSTIGFPFNDDICYVRIGVLDITVYTIDGHMITLNIMPDGNLTMAEDGQDVWAKASNYYNKSQIDSMIAEASGDIVTFKNTVFTNFNQLDVELPCCVHLINCRLGRMFKDEIIYIEGQGITRQVKTIDGTTYTLEADLEGNIVDVTTTPLHKQIEDVVDSKIGDVDDELITIKDTSITNISQLPVDKLPCCFHMFNSDIKGIGFNDDIIYISEVALGKFSVYSIDGAMINIVCDDDGTLSFDKFLHWVDSEVLLSELGQYYNKNEIDSMLAGAGGASAASDVSYDDTNTALGAGNPNAPIDTVQKAIEALAEDDIGSEQVQDMIDESLELLEPGMRFERNVTLWEYTGLAGYINGGKSIDSNEAAQYYLDAGYIIYSTNSNVNVNIVLNWPNVVYEYKNNTLTKTDNVDKITFKSGMSLLEINKGIYIKTGSSNWVDCIRGYAIMQREGIMKYNNATSGLTSKSVQGAIDELAARPAGLDEDTVDQKIADAIAAITNADEVSF